MNIAILGTGSFGCSLAEHLYSNNHNILMWGRSSFNTNELIKTRKLSEVLGNKKLSDGIDITTNIEDAVNFSEIILIVVPSTAIREVCKQIAKVYSNQIILIASKGLEKDTFKTLDEIVKDEVINSRIAVLSGPTHAEEIINKLPTNCVVASYEKEVAKNIQKIFSNKVFRVYTSDDVKGLELGGAIKNIYAIVAGIADGLGYGDNAKAAIITRAIVEVSRLCKFFGADPKTMNGLAGLGDLIVTCSSLHSRNRLCGYYIGKGYSLKEATMKVGMVVEGVNTLYPAYEMANKYGVDTPIINAVYKVINGEMDLQDAVENLISRDLKEE